MFFCKKKIIVHQVEDKTWRLRSLLLSTLVPYLWTRLDRAFQDLRDQEEEGAAFTPSDQQQQQRRKQLRDFFLGIYPVVRFLRGVLQVSNLSTGQKLLSFLYIFLNFQVVFLVRYASLPSDRARHHSPLAKVPQFRRYNQCKFATLTGLVQCSCPA